jgi:hypothetical protein
MRLNKTLGSGKMKKLLYLIFLPILLVILNYQICLAQQVTGPNIILEERSFDAKEVREGTVIEHVFKVLNKGDSPLKINKVSAS